MSATLRVTLVLDREDRRRNDFWAPMLRQLRDQKIVDARLTTFSLAESIASPLTAHTPAFLETLQDDTDILILNWDVINGDPDFGADLALRWFEHRRLAVRNWLNKGGILILEGQAILGVPCGEAYTAVLGPGEVSTCGPEDARKPEAQERRMVGDCSLTALGRKAPGFETLTRLRPRETLTYDDLFPPGKAGRLVAAYIRRADFSRMLYRGWFRRTFRRRATMTWVPYFRCANRWPRNYPTFLVAKCDNKGAIFATTMLLSATMQYKLVQAILLTHGNVASLPEPSTMSRFTARYLPKSLAGLATALLLVLLSAEDPVRKALIAAVVGLLVTIALDLLPQVGRGLHRLLRSVTGA